MAEGLQLHLSDKTSAGYKWVYKGLGKQVGRFVAQRLNGGRAVTTGIFDTAVEAAVAYARAVGGYKQPSAPPPVATEGEGEAPQDRLEMVEAIECTGCLVWHELLSGESAPEGAWYCGLCSDVMQPRRVPPPPTPLAPLPKGWELLHTRGRDPYYHHARTGLTTWERPISRVMSARDYVAEGRSFAEEAARVRSLLGDGQ